MSRKKLVQKFIDEVPDEKLENLPKSNQTLWGETHKQSQTFRLDMQGMTNEEEPKHNLQIQVKNDPKPTSFTEFAPNSITKATLIPGGTNAPPAAEVRIQLKENIDFSQANRANSKTQNKRSNETFQAEANDSATKKGIKKSKRKSG